MKEGLWESAPINDSSKQSEMNVLQRDSSG